MPSSEVFLFFKIFCEFQAFKIANKLSAMLAVCRKTSSLVPANRQLACMLRAISLRTEFPKKDRRRRNVKPSVLAGGRLAKRPRKPEAATEAGFGAV